MKILSIDPSYSKKMWGAVWEGGKMLELVEFAPFKTYLSKLRYDLCALDADHGFDLVVIEDPTFVKDNVQTFKKLCEVVGFIQGVFACPVVKIPPAKWHAVLKRMGVRMKRAELKKASKALAKTIWPGLENDDQADSICLGLYYLQQRKYHESSG